MHYIVNLLDHVLSQRGRRGIVRERRIFIRTRAESGEAPCVKTPPLRAKPPKASPVTSAPGTPLRHRLCIHAGMRLERCITRNRKNSAVERDLRRRRGGDARRSSVRRPSLPRGSAAASCPRGGRLRQSSESPIDLVCARRSRRWRDAHYLRAASPSGAGEDRRSSPGESGLGPAAKRAGHRWGASANALLRAKHRSCGVGPHRGRWPPSY